MPCTCLLLQHQSRRAWNLSKRSALARCISPTTVAPRSQIYVEIERARLTRQLARIKEEEGQVQEAAEILQEVPVVRRRRCWGP
jgi:hypothetical protein